MTRRRSRVLDIPCVLRDCMFAFQRNPKTARPVNDQVGVPISETKYPASA